MRMALLSAFYLPKSRCEWMVFATTEIAHGSTIKAIHRDIEYLYIDRYPFSHLTHFQQKVTQRWMTDKCFGAKKHRAHITTTIDPVLRRLLCHHHHHCISYDRITDEKHTRTKAIILFLYWEHISALGIRSMTSFCAHHHHWHSFLMEARERKPPSRSISIASPIQIIFSYSTLPFVALPWIDGNFIKSKLIVKKMKIVYWMKN